MRIQKIGHKRYSYGEYQITINHTERGLWTIKLWYPYRDAFTCVGTFYASSERKAKRHAKETVDAITDIQY